jgi:hypothetical protein
VAFGPDGNRLASGSDDNTVKVWDARTGREALTLRGHADHVTSMAFSPDGNHLVSGSSDRTVNVWDAHTGQKALTLHGHAGGVLSVAFSPGGSRLASASGDETVKVWDARTGQEALTLRGHAKWVTCVAYSPDGSRLASGGGDRTVRVWETQPVSADDLYRREGVNLVRDLFDRLLLRSEVLAYLRAEPTLHATTRETALQVAQTTSEHPEHWNEAAWWVVREPGGTHDAYAHALRQAEAAVQAAPGTGNYLNTLGVAHYRLGAHAKAIERLEQSEKLRAKQGPLPEDLAFLAMAQHQLGHKEQAHAMLVRLREVMKQKNWAKNAEAQGFLREAEALIEGKPADKK